MFPASSNTNKLMGILWDVCALTGILQEFGDSATGLFIGRVRKEVAVGMRPARRPPN